MNCIDIHSICLNILLFFLPVFLSIDLYDFIKVASFGEGVTLEARLLSRQALKFIIACFMLMYHSHIC